MKIRFDQKPKSQKLEYLELNFNNVRCCRDSPVGPDGRFEKYFELF